MTNRLIGSQEKSLESPSRRYSISAKKIAAVVTAAGYSSRMGTLKALLPWIDTTLINHHIDSLAEIGCDEIIVVTGYKAPLIKDSIKHRSNVLIAHNPDYGSGRVSSIKRGVSEISDYCDAILLIGVDQPRNSGILSLLIGSHFQSEALISSPRFEDKGGHPVIFSGCLKSELLRITERKEGLREIFNKYRKDMNKVIFDDPLVRLDLNTDDDYKIAYEKYCR